jgi:hypothetical protein
MEPEGSLLCSQEPATGFIHENTKQISTKFGTGSTIYKHCQSNLILICFGPLQHKFYTKHKSNFVKFLRNGSSYVRNINKHVIYRPH